MNSGDHVCVVVPKKDGDTVSGFHANEDVWKVGGKGIYAIEGKYLLKWVLVDESVIDNASHRAVYLVVGHEEAWNGNRGVAVACGGESGDVGRSIVD